MKKNKFAILIILILTVASIIFIISRNSKDTLNDVKKTFTIKDTASVVKILLADKNNNKVILQKKEDGSWFLNERYTAKQEMVNILLETMYKIRANYPASKTSRNTVMKILASTGIKVEIYVKSHRINLFDKIKLFEYEKKEKVFYVGAATQDQLGTMMLIEGSDQPMITYIPSFRGYLTTRFSQFEHEWRDNTIFKMNYSDIKSIKINYNEKPENSFLLEKSNAKDFKLYSTYNNNVVNNIDTINSIEFFSKYTLLTYETLIDKTERPSILEYINQTPFSTEIEVTNIYNTKWNIKLYKIKLKEPRYDVDGKQILYDPNSMFAIINNSNDIVTIQYFWLDNILKDITHFYKDKSLTLKK